MTPRFAADDRIEVRPGFLRAFAAMFRDTWREFLDAKVLWLLLLAILLLFGTAVSGRITPLGGGRSYVDLAARAMAADLRGFDLVNQPVSDVAGRLEGAVWTATAAEPLGPDLPTTPWKVTLSRTFVPVAVKPATPEEVRERFGRIADGELWRAGEVRETGSDWARVIGSQTFELEAAPGRDLRLLWMHSFGLFGDSIPLTGERGAPLGLEVLILQKLLATGLGGTILLLVCVAVTAAFVPNMVRKGTLELLLVRPIPRWQLLVFKYVSALAIVAGLLGILVAAVWLITWILAGIRTPGILLALPSLLVFFALLLSVSVLAGTVTRSVTSALLVTVAYWAVLFTVGQLHNQVVESRIREEMAGKPRPMRFADTLRGRPPEPQAAPKPGTTPLHRTTLGRTTTAVYSLLPHTEDLDNLVDRQLMRDYAVAGPFRALMESAEFSWGTAAALTLLHTAAYLAIACAIFSRRDP